MNTYTDATTGRRALRMAAVLAAVVALGSCVATRNEAFLKTDGLVANGQYAEALAALEAANVYGPQDQVLKGLDVGVLEHLAGRYADSTANLERAERLIADYYAQSVSQAAASLLANDTVQDYPGETHEDLFLNLVKALNYGADGNLDGAFVEVRRVNDKLNLLEDRYRALAQGVNAAPESGGQVRAGAVQFHDSALARFLSAVLYRADGRPDDARIDLEALSRAFTAQPALYPFPAPRFDQFLEPAAGARVSLVAFAGRGPQKRALTYRLQTEDGAVRVALERENGQGRLETSFAQIFYVPGLQSGYNFKCQVPTVVTVEPLTARVVLLVDGAQAGAFRLVEDYNRITADTYRLKENLVFAKTVIRTALKGVAAKAAKDEIGRQMQGQGLAGLLVAAGAGLAADAAVEVSEQADLRSARYLPAQAWIGDFDVPAGAHRLTVEYFSADGTLLRSDDMGERMVRPGRLNLWSSWAVLGGGVK